MTSPQTIIHQRRQQIRRFWIRRPYKKTKLGQCTLQTQWNQKTVDQSTQPTSDPNHMMILVDQPPSLPDKTPGQPPSLPDKTPKLIKGHNAKKNDEAFQVQKRKRLPPLPPNASDGQRGGLDFVLIFSFLVKLMSITISSSILNICPCIINDHIQIKLNATCQWFTPCIHWGQLRRTAAPLYFPDRYCAADTQHSFMVKNSDLLRVAAK